MHTYYDEQIAATVENMPKYTKEQKIVKKALFYIERAARENNKRMRECYLNYARGLLESLLFNDDKEEG